MPIESDRLKNTARNVLSGYIYQATYMLMGVVSRYIFIQYLGKEYLGVNGLFANVLGVLSISELGVGSAIGYALYKPLAEGNREEIKSVMALFKKAYWIIGTVTAVIGLALIPLLPRLINNTTGISNLTLYYVLFLFNTVSGYFISYKTILLISDQKEYKLKKINTVGSFVIVFMQMLALVTTRNYLWYLLCDIGIRFAMQFLLAHAVDKEYPYLNNEPAKKLDDSILRPIKKNIRALMIHKLGEVSVDQTDNIIISSFISLSMAGIVSNYAMFITYASMIISILLTSAIPSMGNLIAQENDMAKLAFFKTYRLLSYWIYGWASLGFFFLASPLIELVFGESFLLPPAAVLFIGLSFLMRGEGTAMYNYKVAAGLYNDDKYLAFIGGGINLLVSIVGVRSIGITGVYLGTFVSTLFSVGVRSFIIYRHAFRSKWITVIGGSFRYVVFIVSSAAACFGLFALIKLPPIPSFLCKLLIMIIVPNLAFLAVEGRTTEFQYYRTLVQKKSVKKNG